MKTLRTYGSLLLVALMLLLGLGFFLSSSDVAQVNASHSVLTADISPSWPPPPPVPPPGIV